MDPLGLLLAVASVTIFPGGLYAATTAWLVARAGRLPPGEPRWTAAEAGSAAAALVAAAMAPFPGSPADRVPPDGGAPGNLGAALLLLGVAVALGRRGPGQAARVAAGVIAAVPVLACAAATSGLAFQTVAAVPGAGIGGARILGGAAVLLVLPVLTSPQRGDGVRHCRALVMASCLILVAGLVLPSLLRDHPGWLLAAIVPPAAAAYAGLVGLVRRRLDGWTAGLLAAGAAAAAAATVLALLSGA